MPAHSPSAVLMVRPAGFYPNPETAGTNAFQANGGSDADLTSVAHAEFDRMVCALKEAGIPLVVFQSPEPESPDAIFPNNWFISLPDGRFFLCPMLAPNRRRERGEGVIRLLQETIGFDSIEDWSAYELEGIFLEGTGSIVYDHASKVAYAVRSPRTDEVLFDRLCVETGYTPVVFDSFGRDGGAVYHTNVVLHIGIGYAVFCEESVPDLSQRERVISALRSGGLKVIAISIEQMEAFAGNMLQVSSREGTMYTVCSQTAFDSLNDDQKMAFDSMTQLLPVSIPVIEKTGGGSARCMLAELFIQNPVQES